jgi:hypothetical protein
MAAVSKVNHKNDLKIGRNIDDAQDIRLQKSLLVAGSFMFIAAGALWGIAYILLKEPVAGMIPLSYAIVSFLSVIHFSLTRQYRFFRASQLVLILVLPFLLMVALGGFINSAATSFGLSSAPQNIVAEYSRRHFGSCYWLCWYQRLSATLRASAPAAKREYRFLRAQYWRRFVDCVCAAALLRGAKRSGLSPAAGGTRPVGEPPSQCFTARYCRPLEERRAHHRRSLPIR